MTYLVRALLGLLVALPLALAGPTAAHAAPDPDWVFYTNDTTRYTSPWYAGARRIMVPYGCTRAPYYAPDERCERDGTTYGFHHGIDIALPCGTRILAGRWAEVVDNTSLGTAYGRNPILLRNERKGWDIVIGHTRRVFVKPGDSVKKGTVLAYASDSGAPDGCHLHFEVRRAYGSLATARWPRPLLGLTPVA